MPEITSAWLPWGGLEPNRPTRIIVHCMAEYIDDGGMNELHAPVFLNEYELSAHALVAPRGNIWRCREDDERAWHARGHNAHTLGIEFLVEGVHNYASFVERIKTPYLFPEQYDAGLWQIKDWMQRYGISSTNIIQHSTLSPGRKVDPGAGFPWTKLKADINV